MTTLLAIFSLALAATSLILQGFLRNRLFEAQSVNRYLRECNKRLNALEARADSANVAIEVHFKKLTQLEWDVDKLTKK